MAQLTEHACSAPFSPLEVTEWGEKESERRKKAMVNSWIPYSFVREKNLGQTQAEHCGMSQKTCVTPKS